MNLKLLYPQPLRLLIRDSFSWVVLAAALVVSIWALSDGAVSVGGLNVEQLVAKKMIFLLGVAAVLLVRCCYTFLYRSSYRYEIVRGRLRIVRGVLLQEEAMLPLMPLTELYIRRSWLDYFFGLANLHIAVALERAARIGEIRGLRARDAIQLREHILDLIEAAQRPEPRTDSSEKLHPLLPLRPLGSQQPEPLWIEAS